MQHPDSADERLIVAASCSQAERVVDTSAKPKADVAWASALKLGGASPKFSLTCWNTPQADMLRCDATRRTAARLRGRADRTPPCLAQVDVPHFFASAGVSDGAIDLHIDYRPRAEAGYDTQLPDGSYPEPTSREMFMLGSVRQDYAERFFDADAEAWLNSLKQLEGAVVATPPNSPQGVAGPLLLDVRLPLSDAALAAAAAAYSTAAMRWVFWMRSAEKLATTKTMLTFAHDTKVRGLVYGATVAALSARFGAAGRDIAAADSGPLDIADRGSAQNQAASTNFSDEEKDQTAQDMLALGDSSGAFRGY